MEAKKFHLRHCLRPYEGWALNAAIALDRAHPGFLSSSFCSTNLIRQVHFATLAAIDLNYPEVLAARLRAAADDQGARFALDPFAQIAHYLLELRPRVILEALFGSCPEGLIGLFARLGDKPVSFDRDLYRVAWSFYAEPSHRVRKRLLTQTPGTITAARIRVLKYLDGVLLCRSVLDRVSHPGEVISVREAVRLIQSLVPNATDERLRQSLNALRPERASNLLRKGGLAAWTLGWLERMKNAPTKAPFPTDDPNFRILIGHELVDAGRRYRNCLKQHLGHVAIGRKVFLEWTQEPGAIVELNCLSDLQGQTFFSAGQIRGVGNARPPIDVLKAIRARLGQSGVLFHGAHTGQRAPVNALLDIFEDADVSDTYVSFLDDREQLAEPFRRRAA